MAMLVHFLSKRAQKSCSILIEKMYWKNMEMFVHFKKTVDKRCQNHKIPLYKFKEKRANMGVKKKLDIKGLIFLVTWI